MCWSIQIVFLFLGSQWYLSEKWKNILFSQKIYEKTTNIKWSDMYLLALNVWETCQTMIGANFSIGCQCNHGFSLFQTNINPSFSSSLSLVIIKSTLKHSLKFSPSSHSLPDSSSSEFYVHSNSWFLFHFLLQLSEYHENLKSASLIDGFSIIYGDSTIAIFSLGNLYRYRRYLRWGGTLFDEKEMIQQDWTRIGGFRDYISYEAKS